MESERQGVMVCGPGTVWVKLSKCQVPQIKRKSAGCTETWGGENFNTAKAKRKKNKEKGRSLVLGSGFMGQVGAPLKFWDREP